MTVALYVVINVTCLLILSLLMLNIHTNIDLKLDQRLFSNVLVQSGMLITLDCLWMLGQNYFYLPRSINWAINIAYMYQTGAVSHAWFRYSEYKRDPAFLLDRKKQICGYIPQALLLILALASVRTGWLFYLDEAGAYHRGQLYWVQVLVGFGFIGTAVLRALLAGWREQNYLKKKECYTLASFVILPLIGAVLQIRWFGLCTLNVGVTIAILQLFISFLENKISLDPLTQLNNRNQMLRYLGLKLEEPNPHSRLFLLMLDLDHFKTINDTYGHMEGDVALLRVADALRKACGGKNCFIARFGGDEFVVVAEGEGEQTIERLQHEIRAELEARNRAVQAPYQLTVSIGCAERSRAFQTVPQLIGAADVQLYQRKRERPQTVHT